MSGVHINFTKTHDRKGTIEKCPDCEHWSLFLSFFQEWYGWDSTCLNCGRSWSDGEWMHLPFSRSARKDSIRGAIKRWKRGLQKPEVIKKHG